MCPLLTRYLIGSIKIALDELFDLFQVSQNGFSGVIQTVAMNCLIGFKLVKMALAT